MTNAEWNEKLNAGLLNFLNWVCGKINSTNSSKKKLEILKQIYDKSPNKDDIKWALLNTYSPYIKFGVTSEQVRKWMQSYTPGIFDADLTVEDLLNQLANRTITGHEALDAICGVLYQLPETSREVFYNILDKNLKIRMDAKSINKVIPDLIPIFSVSLCNVYFDRQHKVDFQKDVWLASQKLDGCVSGDTLISVEGGKSLPIKTIVENKIDIKVLTYNTETNKTEYKPIKNHMKNMDDINESSHEWFELELEDGRKLKVTGNHKVYLPELQCWRRVDELSKNDILFII